MIDYILKFPSKQEAEKFGITNGFAATDESGEVHPNLASHSHAICVVGEHQDGAFWILFRDLVGISIPEGAEKFIHWSSAAGIERPTDESTPNVSWA